MERQQLFNLLKLYRSRYGQSKMDEGTMKMWARHLLKYEYEYAEIAFDQLLGAKDWAFGHSDVIRIIEALNPPESEIKAKEIEWSSNYKSNDEKKKYIMKFTRENLGKPNLERELAKEILKVWGHEEYERIKDSIKKENLFKDFSLDNA